MAMPKAQKIQQSITLRLRQLKKRGTLTEANYNHLDKHTHELYELARDCSAAIEKIKKIIC